MAAKFYYVLAFERGQSYQVDSETKTLVYQPQFLGKTSDLSFVTEPEKTIDLDDGTTEVGSEKLTLSFNVLSKVTNPVPLSQVWLIPVIGNSTGWEEGEGPRVPILKVYFKDSEDYRLEVKSGEFEVTKFSAVLRYAVENPAFEYDDRFFVENRLWLAQGAEESFIYIYGRIGTTRVDIHTLVGEERIVPSACAVIEKIYQEVDDWYSYSMGKDGGDVDSQSRGIFVGTSFWESFERSNVAKIYGETSEAYKADLATYAQEWGKTNYPSTPFDVFYEAMKNFEAANSDWVGLDSMVLDDIVDLYPEMHTVKSAVEAGYLPELGDWESLTAMIG